MTDFEERISIIIPAYNEAQAIGALVRETRALYPRAEILVVNDGSTDGTAETAHSAGALVVSHPYNLGNGAAVKTGISNASREFTVLMDADGQHRPEDIVRLQEYIAQYNLVVGARAPGSQTKKHRDFANYIFNWLGTYITRFPIQDLTSGFRVFRREEVLKFLYLFPQGFSYTCSSTLAYLRTGRTIKYVPIITGERVGESKIRLFSDGLRFLIIILKLAAFFAPLRVFLPLALLSAGGGLGFYFYTLVSDHRFSKWSLFFLILGALFYLGGYISEQLARLRLDRIENGGDDKKQ